MSYVPGFTNVISELLTIVTPLEYATFGAVIAYAVFGNVAT
jgi:hypothetical protein